MQVKNIHRKVIGFGTIYILPGETGELPSGYSAEHPIVKFYFKKKWLAKAAVVAGQANEPVPISYEDAMAAVVDEKMNRPMLKSIAEALGIVVDDSDTKKILIEAIQAAQTAQTADPNDNENQGVGDV